MILVVYFKVSYHILRTRAMNDSEKRYEFSVNFRKNSFLPGKLCFRRRKGEKAVVIRKIICYTDMVCSYAQMENKLPV